MTVDDILYKRDAQIFSLNKLLKILIKVLHGFTKILKGSRNFRQLLLYVHF